MAPVKFVIKCGNFAVLVDLHVLPPGGEEDASWFTADRVEEVAALVRDTVDQRVKQYAESLHNRRQRKQKKELAPASALVVKGNNFKLVANFLKRHMNLRCVVQKLYGDLRVFPERYVVCVSRLEDASAHHGNLSLATTEQCEQSRSEYFSSVGGTREPPSSHTKTKRTGLQKIAKRAAVRPGETHQEAQEPRRAEPRPLQKSVSSSGLKPSLRTGQEPDLPTSSSSAAAQSVSARQPTEKISPDGLGHNGTSLVPSERDINQEGGKRCKPSDFGEEPRPHGAKRVRRLGGGPPTTVETRI